MTDQTLARIEQRLAHNRILVGVMCAMAVVVSIGVTYAASNIVVADEVRAHRFMLLGPGGGIADDWNTEDPHAPNTSRRTLLGFRMGLSRALI